MSSTVIDWIIDTDLKICLGQLWEIDDLGSKFNFLLFQSCGQLVFRVSKLFFDIFSWKNNFSEHFGAKNKQKPIKILQIPYKEAIMGFWSPNHGVGCVSSGACPSCAGHAWSDPLLATASKKIYVFPANMSELHGQWFLLFSWWGHSA